MIDDHVVAASDVDIVVVPGVPTAVTKAQVLNDDVVGVLDAVRVEWPKA